MERLDKFLANQTEYSRKEIKELISKSNVKVNDIVVKKSDIKIDEKNDKISIFNKEIFFQKYIYLVLNKPQGYVSATRDNKDKTVIDLVPEEYKYRELFPAGRLDKDTTGLMIITDDGMFAHEILAPTKHVHKTYIVTLDIPISLEMKQGFLKGVKLNDGECKIAELEKLDEYVAKITITEGRYHQIKRMFGCYGAKVIKLDRIRIGNFYLPENLNQGEIRILTKEELELIKEKK